MPMRKLIVWIAILLMPLSGCAVVGVKSEDFGNHKSSSMSILGWPLFRHKSYDRSAAAPDNSELRKLRKKIDQQAERIAQLEAIQEEP